MAFPKQKRDALKSELEAIRKASGDGSLSPAALVEWAQKHPKSQLHKSFEWDDVKASREYRLWQARQIIQEYTVEVVDTLASRRPSTVPFVSVPDLRGTKDNAGSYLPRSVVEAKPDYRQSVLENQIKLLKSMRQNFGWLTELAEVWAAIDNIESPSEDEAA